MKIEIYRSSAFRGGRWRWRTRSRGRIGVWSEGYWNRADCEASIESHRCNLADAEIVEIK